MMFGHGEHNNESIFKLVDQLQRGDVWASDINQPLDVAQHDGMFCRGSTPNRKWHGERPRKVSKGSLRDSNPDAQHQGGSLGWIQQQLSGIHRERFKSHRKEHRKRASRTHTKRVQGRIQQSIRHPFLVPNVIYISKNDTHAAKRLRAGPSDTKGTVVCRLRGF